MSWLVPPPAMTVTKADASLNDPKLIQAAFDEIMDLPNWLAPLVARVQQLHPQPGSRFEDDDVLKPTDCPSDQVINLLRGALDHFEMLALGISHDRVQPLAGYTLIRATIEANALAVWLMMSPSRDRRLRNSIRLSLENRAKTETFNARFIDPGRVSKWFRAEMTATKDQLPGTKNMRLDQAFPKMTSILTETDRHIRFVGYKGLDAWRACSGVAHSNGHFTGASIVKTPNGPSTLVTVSLTTLWMMLRPAKQYLEHTLAQAELYCTPTPGRPPAKRR